MASAKHKAPKGTFDILPGAEAARGRIIDAAADNLGRAGYGRIETPTFEETGLFERGVGAATDIVRKEMFSFEDLGGRSMTLRPEGTAPVCRAYVQHGMQKLPQPVKLWYAGSFYRYEAPQAGRFRQFNQIGAEVIGSDSPLVDAELIILLDDFLRGLGIGGLELRLSSLGSPDARAAYREELTDYLRANEDALAPNVRERIDQNPLRAFDADDAGTREVMAAAPTMLERLADGDSERLTAVRSALDHAGVAYRLDGTLVRGLDYYTQTVFEFTCDRLGAQSGVGGGGRYDGLVGLLGGPPTPAGGWALGVERLLLAIDAGDSDPELDAFVVAVDPERREAALELVVELRRAGLGADLDLGGRSTKGQMKQADRSGARCAILLESDGSVVLKEMSGGEQRVIDVARAAAEVATLRDSATA